VDVDGRIAQTRLLDEPVSHIRQASGQRLRGLEKLGVRTVRDLLRDYPHRYNDFSQVVSIARAPLGEKASVLGTVDEVKVKRPRRRLTIVEVSILDNSGVLFATWFNQPWMAKTLAKGTKVLLLGKIEHSYGYKRMQSPLHTVVEEADAGGLTGDVSLVNFGVDGEP
jgi:ATP-dependent DNA helicase RecG